MSKLEKLLNQHNALMALLPAQAATAAQSTAQAGADLNIYNTVPGRVYQRTGEARRSVVVSATRGKLTVIGTSSHLVGVEFGTPSSWTFSSVRVNWVTGTVTGIPGMNSTKQGPVTVGRTGRNWRVPGPIIAPAAVTAGAFIYEAYRSGMRGVT